MSRAHTKTGAVGILGLQAGKDVKSELFERLRQLGAACAAHQIEHLQIAAGAVQEGKSPNPISDWKLRVADQRFWMFGWKPDGRGFVQSRLVALAALRAALSLPASEPGSDGFFWYGGSLMVIDAFTHHADFAGLLDAELPHLAAREREAKMAQVLDSRASAEAAAPAPARRTARL